MSQTNLNIRIDNDLKSRAKRSADNQKRTLTSAIVDMLEIYSNADFMSYPNMDFDVKREILKDYNKPVISSAIRVLDKAIQADDLDLSYEECHSQALTTVMLSLMYKSFMNGYRNGCSNMNQIWSNYSDAFDEDTFNTNVISKADTIPPCYRILDFSKLLHDLDVGDVSLLSVIEFGQKYSNLLIEDVIAMIGIAINSMNSVNKSGKSWYFRSVRNDLLFCSNLFEDAAFFEMFIASVIDFCLENGLVEGKDYKELFVGGMTYIGDNIPVESSFGYDLDPTIEYDVSVINSAIYQYALIDKITSDSEYLKDYEAYKKTSSFGSVLDEEDLNALWRTDYSQGVQVYDPVRNRHYILIEFAKDVPELGGKHILMLPALD